MLLREVEYARPATVEQAVALLGANDGARALAGGQTLVNVMKQRAAAPEVLVDLADLDELREIGFSSDGML
jgi:carbon-monoxide dehydrogenase medium subunit